MHVSLVMPAFNAEAWIARAIQSALRQSHTDWDLRIHDDGSTDATLRQAREAAAGDPRIEITSSHHRGVTRTMADLWASARGPLLGQIDADDELMPECLARCVAVLAEDPELDYVYTQHAEIDELGRLLRIGRSQPLRRTRGRRRLVAHHFRLFRREVYDRLGPIDETLPAMPDVDLALRLQERARGRFLREVHYLRRRHPHSLSAAHRDLQAQAARALGLVR